MQIVDVEKKAEVKGCAKSVVRLQRQDMPAFCSTFKVHSHLTTYVIVSTIVKIYKL